MWFAKWFGGRQDDSEPAQHPPHSVASAPKVAPKAVRPTPKIDQQQKKAALKGFDPYNSGGFDKHKAWERVIR